MGGAFQIGRLFGISIRLHFSWVFIFGLVTWSLARSFLPDAFPGWSLQAYWGIGLLGSALLFVSVLVHELSHSLVAKHRGRKVRAITLFLLGGVSEIEEEAAKPAEEFWIAVVGPVSSLLLSGIFWAAFIALGPDGNEQARALTLYLGTINLVLGVFNLIPGFPMDGGRVLRAAVWNATGSLWRATRVASNVGILVGWAFIGVGVFVAFSSDFVGGLWLGFIGWFIQSAAGAARQRHTVQASLSGRSVRDAMTTEYTEIVPGTSVQELIEDHIGKRFERAFVVKLGDTFYGLVTVSDVGKVPAGRRARTPVTMVMTRRDSVITVESGDSLEEALRKMAQARVHQLVVVENDEVVGLATRAGMLKVLEIAQIVGGEAERVPDGPKGNGPRG